MDPIELSLTTSQIAIASPSSLASYSATNPSLTKYALSLSSTSLRLSKSSIGPLFAVSVDPINSSVLAAIIMESVREGVEGPRVSRAPTRPLVGAAVVKKAEVKKTIPVKRVEVKAGAKKAAGKKNGKQPTLGKKAFETKPKAKTSPIKDSPEKKMRKEDSGSGSSSPKEVKAVNIAVAKPSKESTIANAELERMFDDTPIVVESDDELSATEMAVFRCIFISGP
jgi:hypothetical protein